MTPMRRRPGRVFTVMALSMRIFPTPNMMTRKKRGRGNSMAQLSSVTRESRGSLHCRRIQLFAPLNPPDSPDSLPSLLQENRKEDLIAADKNAVPPQVQTPSQSRVPPRFRPINHLPHPVHHLRHRQPHLTLHDPPLLSDPSLP